MRARDCARPAIEARQTLIEVLRIGRRERWGTRRRVCVDGVYVHMYVDVCVCVCACVWVCECVRECMNVCVSVCESGCDGEKVPERRSLCEMMVHKDLLASLC